MTIQQVTIIKEIALKLQTETYISDTQIAKRYGVSRQSVWRWSATDITFPTPIKLSAGCTRWKLTDLED